MVTNGFYTLSFQQRINLNQLEKLGKIRAIERKLNYQLIQSQLLQGLLCQRILEISGILKDS